MLDFVNTTESIRESFQPYYESPYLVEKINKRFGTSFNPEYQVLVLRQIVARITGSDSALKHFARQNDMPNFELVYKGAFQEGLLDIAMSNSQFLIS